MVMPSWSCVNDKQYLFIKQSSVDEIALCFVLEGVVSFIQLVFTDIV